LKATAASGATMPSGVAPSEHELGELAARPDASLPLLAPTHGNEMHLLVDQQAVLPQMLATVKGAKQSIDFTMFSLSDTGAGKEMIDALVDRAKAGVDVRVTLDQVGSMVLPVGKNKQMVDRMRGAGVQVAINERIHTGGMNPVDHRKLLIVDNQTAFTGGMNFSAKFGKWHDVMVRIDGPAAQQLSAHFTDRWVDMGGSAPQAAAGARQLAATAVGAKVRAIAGDLARSGVALLANHPGQELHASDHLLDNLRVAKDRAWILTPTLSDPAVVGALKQAAARGVDTRVAVSGPEGWIGTRALRVIGSTFYRELVDAGVKIYEQPGMSHAKVSLIDGVASAGSLNMTRRAMLWDHELMVASDDKRFVGEVEQLFTTDFGRSTLVTPESANAFSARAGEAVRKATGLKW
jgi:cardiolipin synthase